MSNDDIIAIQQQLVAKERAKRMVHDQNMKRDIRSQIAKGGGYNPDGDFPSQEYQEYPKLVYIDGKKPVLVNTRTEENELLGRQEVPPKQVTVDTSQIAAIAAEPAKRRGRPPKEKPAPLPQNLD